MTAVKLDGLATAKAIKAELAERVVALKQRGIVPGLGTLLVGDDPGSHSYVAGKHRDCAEVGVDSIRIDLPASASAADVRAAIRDLNEAKDCTGYIVQLPLPFGIDTNEMLELIDPNKDCRRPAPHKSRASRAWRLWGVDLAAAVHTGRNRRAASSL